MSNIKVVELFAGVGGFRLALEKSNLKLFEIVWANQWEPNKTNQWAFNCYTKHFGESKSHVNENIELVWDKVPKHDLLVGGFPCQDYSVARTNALGIQGKKGVLWWNIKNIFDKHKPKFILLENVDRLIKSPSNQRGRDFGIMLRTLYDAGYDAEWRVINAADYGFNQKRKRVFIFAFLRKFKKNIYKKKNQEEIIFNEGFFSRQFPVKKKEENKEISKKSVIDDYKSLVELSKNFSWKFYNSGCMINGNIFSLKTIAKSLTESKLINILEKKKVDKKYFISREAQKRFEILKGKKKINRISKTGKLYVYSEGKMTFPDDLNKPARTIITSEGAINRCSHVVQDIKTKKLRILTPLECEKINGFNENWTNTGMPERFRYFCMGNALVVPLVAKMAKSLVEIWEEINAK